MKKLYTFFLSIMLAFSLQAQVIEHIYDFNALEIGNINGVDYWTSVANNTGAQFDLEVAFTMLGTVTPDGTNALFYGNGGPNVGPTITPIPYIA